MEVGDRDRGGREREEGGKEREREEGGKVGEQEREGGYRR